MKKSYTYFGLVVAVSALCLGACGKGKTASKATSNSSKVVQTTQTTKTTKTSSSQTASQANSNEEQAKTTTNTQAGEGKQQASVSSSVDSIAISNENYASIAGIWVDGQGNTLTITADGSITDSRDGVTRHLRTSGITPNATVYGFITNGYDSAQKEWDNVSGYEVMPAGAKDSNGNVVTNVDVLTTKVNQGAPTLTYHRQ